MQFFRYFPTIPYEFVDDSNNHFVWEVTDIEAHVKIAQRVRQVVTVFYDYIIQGEERPDTVATKFYGSPIYTWIVLVVNDIFSLFDWPLTNDQFELFVGEKYGTVANAKATLLYFNTAGFQVDLTTYGLLPGSQQGNIQTAYDNELTLNENKRRIQLVPTAFVDPLVAELKKVLGTGA